MEKPARIGCRRLARVRVLPDHLVALLATPPDFQVVVENPLPVGCRLVGWKWEDATASFLLTLEHPDFPLTPADGQVVCLATPLVDNRFLGYDLTCECGGRFVGSQTRS